MARQHSAAKAELGRFNSHLIAAVRL